VTTPVHIHVWNREDDALPDDELDAICHALHTQVHLHAGPIWGVEATVRRVRHPDDVPTGGYLAICQRSIDVQGAAGYHTVDGHRPEIVVSKEFVDSIGMSFPLVFSHEVLEVLGDPLCNRWIHDWLAELGDPVERQSYPIDGIEMSNFVLPVWFEPGSKGPWDYLGLLTRPGEIAPGGYATTRKGGVEHQVYGSEAAQARHLRKVALGGHTRAARIARQLAAA
jgi:hypothetical protein